MASTSSDHIKITIDDQSLDINAPAPAPEPLVSTASMEKTEASDQPQVTASQAVHIKKDKLNKGKPSKPKSPGCRCWKLEDEKEEAAYGPLKEERKKEEAVYRSRHQPVKASAAYRPPIEKPVQTAAYRPSQGMPSVADARKKINDLTPQNSWLIYKVPRRLREVNEKAYEPNAISIGPYHYGKRHLRAMEDVKQSCFKRITEFAEDMKHLEDRVKECYEKPYHLQSHDCSEKTCRLQCHDCLEEPCRPCCHDYVEKIVIDGCFIVNLIRGFILRNPLCNLGRRIQTDIQYDLLLLENQLPFFVLQELDRMITPKVRPDAEPFDRQALHFFKTIVPGLVVLSESENSPFPEKEVKHLLDLVHESVRPSPEGIKKHEKFKAKAKERNSQRSWKFIRSAIELQEAGINFVRAKMENRGQGQLGLLDFEFIEDTKELKIPTLRVDDNTELIFRNLMAYEQFLPSERPTYVSDYVVFMDNLINTGKDVELLCKKRIIDNWLGDYEVVAQMFNKLRDFIYMSESDDFYYAEIFGQVNKHCQRKWNEWKATLTRDYFNSPWSVISFLAAAVLLLLTLLQTIFSGL